MSTVKRTEWIPTMLEEADFLTLKLKSTEKLRTNEDQNIFTNETID